MSITDSDLQRIKEIAAPLINQKAWDAWLGWGSFIGMDFGAKKLIPETGHEMGEWHLWIYFGVWRLEKEGEVIAGSEDERSKLAEIVPILKGLNLCAIDITAPAFDTAFIFEQQVVLRVFQVIFLGESPSWKLYTPDGNVLSIGPGTGWSYTSASKPAQL